MTTHLLRHRNVVTTVLWTFVACVLLCTSAVVRAVQEQRHQEESNYLEKCPFSLKEIPTTLGVWKVEAGGERDLDKLTMRITGGTDHFQRTYVDELTGVKLSVLLLFGPAEPVLPHTPEVCYPANGFGGAEDAMLKTFKYACPDSSGKEVERSASFRSSIYQRANGRRTLRYGVYHSFRLDGVWSPDAASGRKFPRRNPGVFKVQVQREVAENERRNDSSLKDPMEEFLAILIPEVEREIRRAALKETVSK